MGWRLRGLLNLVASLDVLRKTGEPGRWIVAAGLYLGIMGSVLTALAKALAEPVIRSANVVPRPQYLPIISKELEVVMLTYPQLYYGLGLHGHLLMGLYLALPAFLAFIAAVIGADKGARDLLLTGRRAVDLVDYLLLAAVFATAFRVETLLVHRVLGWVWTLVSLALGGLARRIAVLALTSLYQLVMGGNVPRVFSRLVNKDTWLRLIAE